MVVGMVIIVIVAIVIVIIIVVIPPATFTCWYQEWPQVTDT